MKYSISALFVMVTILLSCSTDKDNEENAQKDLEGSWVVTSLQIDDETASDNAKYGKQILDYLTENNCVVLTFIFKSDMSVELRNSVNYIEIGAGQTGLQITCPTETDIEMGTYSYDGVLLTIINEEGESETVRVSIDGAILSMNAADLDIPNFNEEGELIFQKI